MKSKVQLYYQKQEISFLEAFKLAELDFLTIDLSLKDPYETAPELQETIKKKLKIQLLLAYQIVRDFYYSFKEEDLQFVFSLFTQWSILNEKSASNFYFEEIQKAFEFTAEPHQKGIVLDTLMYDLYESLQGFSSTEVFRLSIWRTLDKYDFSQPWEEIVEEKKAKVAKSREQEMLRQRTFLPGVVFWILIGTAVGIILVRNGWIK